MHNGFDYNKNICDENAINILVKCIDYLMPFSGDFSVFLKGIGVSAFNKTSSEATNGSTIYQPKFISDNKYNEIYFWQFGNRISLIIMCFSFQDFKKANVGFHEINKAIRKSFPAYETRKINDSQGNTIEYYQKGKKILNLTLKKFESNEYSIQIQMLGKK